MESPSAGHVSGTSAKASLSRYDDYGHFDIQSIVVTDHNTDIHFKVTSCGGGK